MADARAISTAELSSFVTENFMPLVPSQVALGSAALYRLTKASKYATQGGKYLSQDIIIAENPAKGSYRGAQNLVIDQGELFTNETWNWKQVYVSMFIDGYTEITTDSKNAAFDYVKKVMKVSVDSLKGLLNWYLLLSDGTGNPDDAGVGKDPEGLPRLISSGLCGNGNVAANSTTGWIAYTNTSAISGYKTVVLDNLDSEYEECVYEDREPDMLLCGVPSFKAIWRGFQNLVQYPMTQAKDLAAIGVRNFMFNKAAVVKDRYMDKKEGAFVAQTTTTRPLLWLHTPSLHLVIHSKRGMTWTGFKEPYDMDAAAAQIFLALNNTCSERRVNGYNSSFNPIASS